MNIKKSKIIGIQKTLSMLDRVNKLSPDPEPKKVDVQEKLKEYYEDTDIEKVNEVNKLLDLIKDNEDMFEDVRLIVGEMQKYILSGEYNSKYCLELRIDDGKKLASYNQDKLVEMITNCINLELVNEKEFKGFKILYFQLTKKAFENIAISTLNKEDN